MSKSKEFNDIQLRVNEKRPLNTLNRDKNRVTIRSDMFILLKMKNNITADFNCGLEMHNGGGSTQSNINEITVFFQISHGGKDQNQ